MENEFVSIPLCQFLVGQKLHIKFSIPRDFEVYCPAQFIKLERGRVVVKCLDGWTPNWYGSHSLEKKYPDRIATVLAKKCYLWGKNDKDHWDRCHWFNDTKTIAE
jgi:hypothetical protein